MLKKWHNYMTLRWLNRHAKHGEINWTTGEINWTTGYLVLDKPRHFTCETCGAERGQR